MLMYFHLCYYWIYSISLAYQQSVRHQNSRSVTDPIDNWKQGSLCKYNESRLWLTQFCREMKIMTKDGPNLVLKTWCRQGCFDTHGYTLIMHTHPNLLTGGVILPKSYKVVKIWHKLAVFGYQNVLKMFEIIFLSCIH